MNYSQLIHSNTRAAMPARDILSIKPWAALAVLILSLAVGLAVLAGSPSAIAQEQKLAATSTVDPAPGRVNINSADAQTLATGLKGVGESRAIEIVRYREAYGPFASIDELTEVKGIGKSTLDSNRDLITLE
jgi:competence protein ComEA